MKSALLHVLAFVCLALRAAGADDARPFLAIWQDDDHRRPESGAPYLRVAIWEDGRVLFANNPHKWGHQLREGRIDAARVAELKKAIAATPVFDLPGHCYLVPDAPVNCVMLDLSVKRQMLYWDEVETPNYGININPKPHHRQFIAAWKAVNRLALEATPRNSKATAERFQLPPKSWRLKPKIQSE